MFPQMLLQALMTACCGLLIRESCGYATTRLAKLIRLRLNQSGEELSSIFLLPDYLSLEPTLQEYDFRLQSNYFNLSEIHSGSNLHLLGEGISHFNESGVMPELASLHSHKLDFSYTPTRKDSLFTYNSWHFPVPESNGITLLSQTHNQNVLSDGAHYSTYQDPILATMQPIWQIILREKEKQIQILTKIISMALAGPEIYTGDYQSHNNFLPGRVSQTPKYDLRGAKFYGGFAENVLGNSSNITHNCVPIRGYNSIFIDPKN